MDLQLFLDRRIWICSYFNRRIWICSYFWTGEYGSVVILTGEYGSAVILTGEYGSAVILTGEYGSAVILTGEYGSAVILTGEYGSAVIFGQENMDLQLFLDRRIWICSYFWTGEYGSAVILDRRIWICSYFASQKQIELLNSSSAVFFDATFKVVPQNFHQLFTVFVPRNEYVFPAVFILMTKKIAELYTAIFNKIEVLAPLFKHVHVMADFEDAISLPAISLPALSLLATSLLATLLQVCITFCKV